MSRPRCVGNHIPYTPDGYTPPPSPPPPPRIHPKSLSRGETFFGVNVSGRLPEPTVGKIRFSLKLDRTEQFYFLNESFPHDDKNKNVKHVRPARPGPPCNLGANKSAWREPNEPSHDKTNGAVSRAPCPHIALTQRCPFR